MKSAAGVVCEGLHSVDSAAEVVREGLIPGHLREGDGVSRFIRPLRGCRTTFERPPEFLRSGFHLVNSALGVVCEGFHSVDSAADVVREA